MATSDDITAADIILGTNAELYPAQYNSLISTLASAFAAMDTEINNNPNEVASKAYVNSQILGGGTPSSIAITALGAGTSSSGNFIQNSGGSIVGTAPSSINITDFGRGSAANYSFLRVDGSGNVVGILPSGALSTGSFLITDNVGNITTYAFPTNTTTAVSKTLAVNERCRVIGAGVTLTLPASPSDNTQCVVYKNGYTDIVVTGNGANINGVADDITLNSLTNFAVFTYTDATYGWHIGG